VTVADPLPLDAPGTVTDPPTPLEMVGSEAVCGCDPTAIVAVDVAPALEGVADGAGCGSVVTPPPPPQAASAATATRTPSPTKRLRMSISQ